MGKPFQKRLPCHNCAMLLTHLSAFLEDSFAPTRIRLEGGRIVAVSPELAPLSGEEVRDLGGDCLLPGFVDVHSHAFQGRDTMEGEAAVRHMSRQLYQQGVAAFLPTTMSASPEDTRGALAGIAAVMERPEPRGARVLGAHMEAPFLAPAKCGAQVAAHFMIPSWAHFEKVTGPCLGCVSLITLAPELPGAEDFTREATRRGITVSLGHTAAGAQQTHLAGDWGASHVTHTFNAQTPLNHREPGVPGAALGDDRFYCEFIADGIHLHPDILRIAARCKGSRRLVLITDAMEAAGMPDGEYALGGQTVYVKEGAARLANGVLAGSTLTMSRAFQNMIALGIDPVHAARMATATPADSIHRPEAGRIAPGGLLPLTRWNARWELREVIG